VAAVAVGAAATVFGIVHASAAAGGPIKGLAGKCVDVAAAKTANGTHVQLFDCNGTGAQSWTLGDDGTLKALGKCLDVTGGSTASGAKVQISTCGGAASQKWTASGGQLVNAASGKCLDVTDHSAANGNQLQIWACTGGSNQTWVLPGSTTPVPSASAPSAPSVTVPPTVAPTLIPPTVVPPVSTPPTTPSGGFVHPGVLDSRASLDFVKAKVAAKQQPWLNAYNQMLSNGLLSQSRQPAPRATVECGSYSNPNNGCTEERQDALAAYGNALAWYISGDTKYATKAISYMNAWAPVIKAHTNSNGPLQTGWAGSTWPRAAEIIRYTYTGWAPADVEKFSAMLRTVYLPTVIKGINSNGNWELTMMEAAVGISVFLDDRASYTAALAKFNGRVPAYVYLKSDGAIPKAPPGSGLKSAGQIASYWQGQTTYVDGIAQETCRDFVHTGYGLTNIEHVAEITHIQGGGGDLWPALADRVQAALEFHTNLDNGAPVPADICGGKVQKGLASAVEVGYNALVTRMGRSLPHSKQYLDAHRPMNTNVLFVGWDTLTHANNPN
jgi:hypothetical protein